MADVVVTPRLDLLEAEFARELQRKKSLEQRGITVITASGTLVTLVFGFSALLTKGQTFGNFDTSEQWSLVVALGLFIIASWLGVSANIPRAMGHIRSAKSPPEDDPERYYKRDVWEALRTGTNLVAIADEMSDAITTTKVSNRQRAQAVRWATTCQLGAIVALGIAVCFIIFHPPQNVGGKAGQSHPVIASAQTSQGVSRTEFQRIDVCFLLISTEAPSSNEADIETGALTQLRQWSSTADVAAHWLSWPPRRLRSMKPRTVPSRSARIYRAVDTTGAA